MDNIRKYYLFQFFSNLAFFSPVIVLFWQANGLTMSQIMLLQSIYSIGVVILELPTGVFADFFGKRVSLILGSIFWTIGLTFYGLSHNFWQFAVGEIVVGTGAAFISGADRAFLHAILKSNNEEHKFQKIEGNSRGFNQIAQAISSLIGGFIGAISLNLTLIFTGFSTFISFIISIFFSKTKIELPREEKTDYFSLVKDSLKLIRNHKKLLWLTLFFAIFNAFIWPLNFFSQPYLKMLDVPIIFFGIIFAALNVISAVGSTLTQPFEKVTKDRFFSSITLITVISLFVVASFPSIIIFPLWGLFLTFAFMSQTVISYRVLQIIPSHQSATILSFQNLLRRLFYAFIGPLLGLMSDKLGLQTALQIYAVIMLVVLGFILYKSHPELVSGSEFVNGRC